MLKLRGIDHVVIRAINAPRLIDFYCDVLGCEPEREAKPGLGLTQLRAGNALIDIVALEGSLGQAGGSAPDPNARNMDHFCLALEDFDEQAIRKHLALHNIEASARAQRYGAEGYGPSLYIDDPEGNTIELKGPPAS